MSTLKLETEKLLKKTISRCPVCRKDLPAEVWQRGREIFLNRTCPEHGFASTCISSDGRFYHLAQGEPANSCCDGANSGGSCCSVTGKTLGTLGRNAHPGEALGTHEKLATCLALIEIVNSCNLKCPTCYADSPFAISAEVDAIPLADLQRRIQGVIDRKGGIEILQLSGGEPTLHPQFFELLEWIRQNPSIDYILLNTNGVRIATDPDFVRRLGEFYRLKDDIRLYLQFDGVQEAGAQSRSRSSSSSFDCSAGQLHRAIAQSCQSLYGHGNQGRAGDSLCRDDQRAVASSGKFQRRGLLH